MKNLLLILIFICTFPALAQDELYAKLSEAKSSYSSGNLEDARYTLQQSLVELDMLIGKEVIKILPDQLAGLNYTKDEDEVTGNAMGITGSSVQRNYQEGEKSVNFNLMNNSPMLSMITAFLTNPMFAMAGDGSQKQLKISGYKAVLQKNGEEGDSFTIQIPINQSLVTLDFNKFNEQEAVKAAESLNVSAIAELIN